VIIAFRQTIGRLIAAFFRSIYDLLTGQIAQRSLAQERAMLWLLVVSLLPLGLTFVLRDFYQRIFQRQRHYRGGLCLMGTGPFCIWPTAASKGVRPPGICVFGRFGHRSGSGAAGAAAPVARSGSTLAIGFFWGWSEATPFPSLLLWASHHTGRHSAFRRGLLFQPAPH
jgi:hypothetical protein